MNVDNIQNNQIVRYRLGKHTDGSSPNWNEWVTGSMYCQHNRDGKLVTITPNNECWSEFSSDDFSSDFNTFDCEEYLMEIDPDSL